jgi:hypothetical protein
MDGGVTAALLVWRTGPEMIHSDAVALLAHSGPLPSPPRPARSADRTQSPVAVSKNREYSRMWPETIGDFLSEGPNPESGDRQPIRKSPQLAGLLALPRVKSPGAGLPG